MDNFPCPAHEGKNKTKQNSREKEKKVKPQTQTNFIHTKKALSGAVRLKICADDGIKFLYEDQPKEGRKKNGT